MAYSININNFDCISPIHSLFSFLDICPLHNKLLNWGSVEFDRTDLKKLQKYQNIVLPYRQKQHWNDLRKQSANYLVVIKIHWFEFQKEISMVRNVLIIKSRGWRLILLASRELGKRILIISANKYGGITDTNHAKNQKNDEPNIATCWNYHKWQSFFFEGKMSYWGVL